MATVRLDTTTETKLKRLATRRGQNRSEVIRDAIDHLSEGEGALSALEKLRPFVGIADSGGRQLSTATGRRFRELMEQKQRARRSR
jgi:predicted DNA-binding protein